MKAQASGRSKKARRRRSMKVWAVRRSTQDAMGTWSVDRGCRAEATEEAQAAILFSCSLLLLLVRLLLGFQ